MGLQILISLLIITITIIIHGLGTAFILGYLSRRHTREILSLGFRRSMVTLSITAIFLMILHYLEIALWAGAYYQIPEIEKLQTWEESIYFSMVTYATLGYGDITLPPVWRIMSGFEAMNGILLFGWSTALFYAVVQKILLQNNQKKQ